MRSQPDFSEEEFKKAKTSKFPGFMSAMLATLTEVYFDDPDWIYEPKLDGVRCIVTLKDGVAQLFSRNENDMSKTYPELKSALEKTSYPNLIMDGEIVAFDKKVTSFSKLQNRIHLEDSSKIKVHDVKVYLYLFDIMYYDTKNLTDLSLLSRKNILKQIMEWTSPICFVDHRKKNGTAYLKEACAKRWEGIIAKNAHSKYVHSRSKNWLKFKCTMAQELVIGGFTSPQGERKGFGALLVGYYKDDELLYAGKVGTGFTEAFLEKWKKKFDMIRTDSSPFANYNKLNKGTNHWLEPTYVGQFGFAEWTKNNKLRHPRFLGLRHDKDPKKVVMELPK